MSDTSAFLAAIQITQTLIVWLWWPTGLVFMVQWGSSKQKNHFLTGFSLRLHVAGAGGKANLLKERSPQSSPEKAICILQNLLPEGLSFNKLASKY